MNLDTLKSLRERVLAASGPDRDLDGLVCGAVGMIVNPRNSLYLRWPDDADTLFWQAPRITDSIDAALALVERTLPGAMWAAGNMEDGPFCRLVIPDGRGGYIGGAYGRTADTAPLAILAALLAALISQQEHEA